MAELLLINPNMVFPSESSISGRPVQIRDIEKVINLGLLSVASYLHAGGISLKILDLVGKKDDMELIRKEIEAEKPKFIGVSCLSCFTYPKLIEYSNLIKSMDDSIFMFSGGQHISGIPRLALEEVPNLDCVVKGEGEYICRQIMTHLKGGISLDDVPSIAYRKDGEIIDNTDNMGDKVDLETLPFLQYDLYPDFQEYSPHVEESRWCAFACNFCTSGAMGRGMAYKSVTRFVDELEYVKSFYNGRKDLKFFFACSTFGLKRSRIEEVIRQMKERRLDIKWRTETRADAPVVEYLDQLTEVGLRVMDLGLESGSPKMLTLMNKCKDPEAYLEKAGEFVEIAGKTKKLLLKVNLVFYAGETPQTIRETLKFLLDHAEHIDSMSAGPVVVYSGIPLENKLQDYEAEHGTTLVDAGFWDEVHAHPVNPSAHFSFNQLNAFALIVSKMLCPEEEYFEVKRHGQFPLDMDLNEFRKQSCEQEENQLPFDFDWKERLSN